MVEVKIKHYQVLRYFDKDAEAMAKQGWRVTSQSQGRWASLHTLTVSYERTPRT